MWTLMRRMKGPVDCIIRRITRCYSPGLRFRSSAIFHGSGNSIPGFYKIFYLVMPACAVQKHGKSCSFFIIMHTDRFWVTVLDMHLVDCLERIFVFGVIVMFSYLSFSILFAAPVQNSVWSFSHPFPLFFPSFGWLYLYFIGCLGFLR